MDDSRTLRILELYACVLSVSPNVYFSNSFTLYRQANNALPVISKVYYCNFVSFII